MYGITPYRFDAINGWKIDSSILNHEFPTNESDMNPGRIGCYLSHLSVIQDAYKSGYSRVWILEDDFDIIRSVDLIPQIIHQLEKTDPKWDILFTDIDMKNPSGKITPATEIPKGKNKLNYAPSSYYYRNKKIHERIQEVGLRYGMHSYILSKSGMKKILDFVNNFRIELAIDLEMFLIPDLHSYRTTCDIVTNLPPITSDTIERNGL
jgi:GR25 family glycosyltransferase involved in LPS biosynthesis